MSSPISHQQPQSQLSIEKRARKIHKNQKKGEKICRKRPVNGHGHNQLKNAGSKSKIQSLKKRCLRPDYWLNDLKQWFQSDPTKVRECMDEQISEMPILESVQQLFSLSTKKKLTSQMNQNDLNRYSKVVSFTDNDRTQNILFKGEEVSGIGHIVTNRYGANVVNSMLIVSPQESETVEKRVSFMEKLKENEEKYDASITKMSYISKELAFTYRMYLQKRSQLCDSFNSISSRFPIQQERSQSIQSEYARILIKKNLTHAFQRIEVEPLNYFKHKQSSASNRSNQYQHILNIDSLKEYMIKKKPKKVNKNPLATACSICLSDYYELNNPFTHCNYCGMRAHQLCYSFQHSRCGYCAYQKIERHLKEEVSWCFICKQSGLFTIKFNDKEYAHGFCLLVHGLWRIPNAYKSSRCSLETSQRIQCNSSDALLQPKYRNNSKSIQFINPHQPHTICSIPVIGSGIFEQNQPIQQQVESQQNSSLRDIRVMQQSQSIRPWENQDSNSMNTCACCRQAIYRGYYLTCETCGKVYHASCAYLSGFDLKIIQHKWYSNSQNCIELNCCCQNTYEISWSRKYRLNYKRIAFDIEATRPHIKDGLNFNY